MTLSANTTAYTYTDQGYLYEANITDGNPRYAVFEEDLDGHITRRFENDANSSGYWDELHFYFNGKELGHISTNGTSDVSYAQSIIDHTTVPGNGMFRDGGTTASPYTWYDTSYQAINGETYQPESSSYTVAAGDTLQSIAYQLWGDASFWYLIADANGLNSGATTRHRAPASADSGSTMPCGGAAAPFFLVISNFMRREHFVREMPSAAFLC